MNSLTTPSCRALPGRNLLAFLLAVSCAAPALAWRVEYATNVADLAAETAVDSQGDVVSVGLSSGQFVVIKLHGLTGQRQWRRLYRGDAPGDDNVAQAVAIDDEDNVYAGGRITNSATENDFFVVKLNGRGREEWSTTIDGAWPASGKLDRCTDLILDSRGDVFAVGAVDTPATGLDLAVIKLDGETGAMLWRREIDGRGESVPGALVDLAMAVALDPEGNPVVVGYMYNGDDGSSEIDYVVIKFNGQNGAELWRHEVDDGDAGAGWCVTVDDQGDVVTGGRVNLPEAAFTVLKLDGTDGRRRWSYFYAEEWEGSEGTAKDLALTSNGDVIACGAARLTTPTSTGADAVVVRISGSTGDPLWERRYFELGIEADDGAFGVAVNAADEIFVSGAYHTHIGHSSNLSVRRLSGATGDEVWHTQLRGSHDALGDYGIDVALDGSGGVFVVGGVSNLDTGLDLAVLRLNAANGTGEDFKTPELFEDLKQVWADDLIWVMSMDEDDDSLSELIDQDPDADDIVLVKGLDGIGSLPEGLLFVEGSVEAVEQISDQRSLLYEKLHAPLVLVLSRRSGSEERQRLDELMAAGDWGRPARSTNAFLLGDTNGDGRLDVSDASFALNFQFGNGESPSCMAASDANGDGGHDISDPVFLLIFLFASGESPGSFPSCDEASVEACSVDLCVGSS